MRKRYIEELYFYLVFALSGALTSIVSIWYPAFQIAKKLEPNNIAVSMPKLYYFMSFLFSFVMAPALIVIFMNQNAFIKAFVQSLLGDEE